MTLPQETNVMPVGQVIELSIAPVFVLSAIGALLMVLTSRLARIIDRARVVEAQLPAAAEPPSPGLQGELGTLSQPAMLIHRAITLARGTAVLVCSVIVSLFLGTLLEVDVTVLVALLFIGSMIFFLGSLLTLMRELFVATASLRFGKR